MPLYIEGPEFNQILRDEVRCFFLYNQEFAWVCLCGVLVPVCGWMDGDVCIYIFLHHQ